jgi:hypothetical protein
MAGPVREQPHRVLGRQTACHGARPPRPTGRPVHGHPRRQRTTGRKARASVVRYLLGKRERGNHGDAPQLVFGSRRPVEGAWRSAAKTVLECDPIGGGVPFARSRGEPAGAGQLLTVLGYIPADAVSSGKRRKDRFTAPGTGRREPNTSCGEPRQTADISVAASDSFEAVPRTTTAQASGPRERTPRCRRSARYPRASPRSARGRAAPRRRRARRSARRSA